MPLIFFGVWSIGYATFWCYLVRDFGGRGLAHSDPGVARSHGWDLVAVERRLGLAWEPTLQGLVDGWGGAVENRARVRSEFDAQNMLTALEGVYRQVLAL